MKKCISSGAPTVYQITGQCVDHDGQPLTKALKQHLEERKILTYQLNR